MTKPVTRPKRAPSHPGRISLVVKDFDDLVIDQGIKVRVTPTLICPNITDLSTYNHDLNCTVCDNGTVDIASQSIETWAFVQGVTHDENFGQDRIWEFRDARITFQVELDMRVNYWYKIEVLDFTMPYNELIKRKAGGTADITRYFPQDDATITKFYLVDKAGTEYTLGTDFDVLGKGIDWTGTPPADNTIYSISYPMLPTFRIMDLLHDNRYYYDDFKRVDKVPKHLPQQAHIRFDFLARSKGYEETNDDPPTPGSEPTPPFKTGFNA